MHGFGNVCHQDTRYNSRWPAGRFSPSESSRDRTARESLRDVPQPCNPADRHPLDDKDITIGIERCMVGVDEPAGLPRCGLPRRPSRWTRRVQASS